MICMSENESDKEKLREPIPAYRDTFVHFLFGTPGNEPLLLHFLNSVLESDGQLPTASVEVRNPFNPATFATEKWTILDVKATDERGAIFMVEFQTSERQAFADRMTYYGCRSFGGQHGHCHCGNNLYDVSFCWVPPVEEHSQFVPLDSESRFECGVHQQIANAHFGGGEGED